MSYFEVPEPRKPEDLLDESELLLLGINRKHMNFVVDRMTRELEWWANMRFMIPTEETNESDNPNLKQAGTLIDFQLPETGVSTLEEYTLQLGRMCSAQEANLREYAIGIALWEEALTNPEESPITWYSI